MLDLFQLLSTNSYPGRGIVLGRSADNKKAVIAYFIMGRSENSRNRVFEATEDGIRTRAYDESKMTDPSLIIYHPVRVVDGTTIVTNGDQTDTIADAYRRGEGFVRALRTREFEPDCPNYTPRISGAVRPDGSYRLSILKSANGDPACCQRFFFEYEAPIAGQAHFISTYQGDGSPLPSFEGEPRTVALDAPDAASLASRLWESLNEENKVSLFVSYLDLETGKADSVIINKHQ
ncbi:IMP cyclohydrolase [Pseudoflavonifractor sp. CLA-AP-H29]|uniref:IMP cyclohydrolase n=1 Tax=Pseudoflavonifractor intestinihominis TaxID=3133171 RepID=A0ABV1EBU2_9FIRM